MNSYCPNQTDTTMHRVNGGGIAVVGFGGGLLTEVAAQGVSGLS